MKFARANILGGEKVYPNLIEVMKNEKITFTQIGELLECRYQTVSDIVNGNTIKGFHYEDACKIHKVFFPKYDMEYLFKRQ